MGPRLLCFVGGAGLTCSFVLLSLLATPFFGAGAFVWASAFACFLLALALGQGLGDLVVSFAGERLSRAAPALAVAGGILSWLAAYLLPTLCRAVLERNPESTFAPTLSIALASLLPGTLIAGILPCELRARLVDCETPRVAARITLRLMGLMTLGGVFGIVLTAKPLLRADEVEVWRYAYGAGALLAGLGLAFLSTPLRLVTGALLLGLVALSAIVPSEVQSHRYQVALQTAWREGRGAGLYYRWTSGDGQLSAQDLQRLAAGDTSKQGVILTLEMLERIGQTSVEGDGLRRTVDLLLDPGARPYILPFFEHVKSVRSDGRGMLYVEIKQQQGKHGAEFTIPGADAGDTVRFWYKEDFTIRLLHQGNRWRLEVGPQTREQAGFLEFNDSITTPLRVLDVALWVDASVLAVILEDLPDQVVVKAEGQGEIGTVKTVELHSIPKPRPPRSP